LFAADIQPTPTEQQSATPAEPEKKPQATFGSFSSKASPFASAGGASPFGSASSSSPFGAASKSSPFATAAASSTSAFGSAAAKPAAAAASVPKGGFASSGFGNYSNAFSTFAKKPAADDTSKAGPSTSFGDILKERGEEVEETKLQLNKQDGELRWRLLELTIPVPTGEEEESTVYQTRVKLFALDDEVAGWKERGVGSLKLNKRRDGTTGGRLGE
jgi:Ran-binding protein 3